MSDDLNTFETVKNLREVKERSHKLISVRIDTYNRLLSLRCIRTRSFDEIIDKLLTDAGVVRNE